MTNTNARKPVDNNLGHFIQYIQCREKGTFYFLPEAESRLCQRTKWKE